LKHDYESAGKSSLFEALRPWLVFEPERIPQTEIASRLGMTITAVGVSLFRLRGRYVELLREEIANTLSSVDDVDDELERLKAVIVR
jgi:RNA polymerase sigma-70 factor (ECF subfamily)